MTPHHILVASDYSEPARRALEQVRWLHARLGAAVTVVHVHHDPLVAMRSVPDTSLWASEAQREAHLETAAEDLRTMVRESFGPDWQAVTVRVAIGEPAIAIPAVAKEIGADLICVGTTGKTGIERVLLGSVAERLVRESSVPVLSVP